jgi:hypothetical protein
MTEFALARQELDLLNTSLAQKRQALRPAAAPTPKRVERQVQSHVVEMTTPGVSTAKSVTDAAAKAGNPEFIVVIERGTNP